MRRISSLSLVALVFALLVPMRGFAAKNVADYPLRVHIFSHNSISHYSGYGGIRSLNDVDGEAVPTSTKTPSLAASTFSMSAMSAS